MIVSIGEILADMIGEKSSDKLTFNAFTGGAPFNVAVNAKKAGAKVGFIGKVGKDVIGRFLLEEAKKAQLDDLDIQIDEERNTTLAFVSLNNGERDFAFNRHDTADYNIESKKIDFSKYGDLKIVHLGSLMLSEKEGVKLAKAVSKKVKKANAKLSFDMNFRMDIYKDFEQAKNAYKPFVECADIIKFSDDELKQYTGIEDFDKAVEKIYRKDLLLVITLGSRGSYYKYNSYSGIVETEKVKPLDTTGAGDAFFGTFLANIEGKELTEENIKNAMIKGNKAGADATQFYGAIKL